MSMRAYDIPSAKSTGAPYVAGNFAPLRSEVTAAPQARGVRSAYPTPRTVWMSEGPWASSVLRR